MMLDRLKRKHGIRFAWTLYLWSVRVLDWATRGRR